jgi:hypothetical protein
MLPQNHRLQQNACCSSQRTLAEQGRGWPDVLRTWPGKLTHRRVSREPPAPTVHIRDWSDLIWVRIGLHNILIQHLKVLQQTSRCAQVNPNSCVPLRPTAAAAAAGLLLSTSSTYCPPMVSMRVVCVVALLLCFVSVNARKILQTEVSPAAA